jgi:hypothetical protein
MFSVVMFSFQISANLMIRGVSYVMVDDTNLHSLSNSHF